MTAKNQRVVSEADYRLIQERKAAVMRKIPRRKDWFLALLTKWAVALDKMIEEIEQARFHREYDRATKQQEQ